MLPPSSRVTKERRTRHSSNSIIWQSSFFSSSRIAQNSQSVRRSLESFGTRFNARKNNAGWRIDYFLTSNRLREQIVCAPIYAEVFGSDHCPVGLMLDMEAGV